MEAGTGTGLITRAVILARGLGMRMRREDPRAQLAPAQERSASLGMKGMISVGRPFLDYVISALADAGITDVCLVIGPEHDEMRRHFSSCERPARVRVHFAVQPEPRGTADAVLAARAFADGHPFLALNADNYYPVGAYRLLVERGAPSVIGFEAAAMVRASNIPEERLRRFALITSDSKGCLREIVEKPDERTFDTLIGGSAIGMNLWAFQPSVFEACARVTPSERGELEIQDAVRILVRELGECVRVYAFAGGVLDLSTRADIAEVARRLAAVDVRL